MRQWLAWASAELSLHGIDTAMWTIKGSQLCKLDREEFTARCPPFVGDILWEHLDMMKKGECMHGFMGRNQTSALCERDLLVLIKTKRDILLYHSSYASC